MSDFLKSLILVSSLSILACSQPYSENAKIESSDFQGIIGGQPVIPKSEISKSIVGIFDAVKGSICTGSLLPGNIVLTAAHCIGPVTSQTYIIFSVNLISTLQTNDIEVIKRTVRPVTSTAVHPGWDTKKHSTQGDNWNDIALIKFEGSIPADFAPAQLLEDANDLQVGTPITLAGYGVSLVEIKPVDSASFPNIEQAIAQQEVFCSTDRKQCVSLKTSGSGLLRSVETTISELSPNEVALDQRQGKGACSGDSGGPAYVIKNGAFKLWGITSRGTPGCGHDSIYTNALSYLDWINLTIPKLK